MSFAMQTIQAFESRLQFLYVKRIYVTNVCQVNHVPCRKHLRIVDALLYLLQSVLSQNVICILAIQIVFFPYMLHHQFAEPLADFIQQGNLSVLVITKHDDLLKLVHEVPTVWDPSESLRSRWYAHGILESSFSYRQAVKLPFRQNQSLVLRVALLHSKQDRSTFWLAPFLVLVLLLVKVRFTVLNEKHLSVHVIERKYQDVLMIRLCCYFILVGYFFRYSTGLQILNCRRFRNDLLFWLSK